MSFKCSIRVLCVVLAQVCADNRLLSSIIHFVELVQIVSIKPIRFQLPYLIHDFPVQDGLQIN